MAFLFVDFMYFAEEISRRLVKTFIYIYIFVYQREDL